MGSSSEFAHPALTRANLAAELRWLADARSRYETDVFPSIAREVQTARQLADIIERQTPVADGGAGFGWIPSWLWDEWDGMAAVPCPQPCEHLSQEDAREGRKCPEHPCTCVAAGDDSMSGAAHKVRT